MFGWLRILTISVWIIEDSVDWCLDDWGYTVQNNFWDGFSSYIPTFINQLYVVLSWTRLFVVHSFDSCLCFRLVDRVTFGLLAASSTRWSMGGLPSSTSRTSWKNGRPSLTRPLPFLSLTLTMHLLLMSWWYAHCHMSVQPLANVHVHVAMWMETFHWVLLRN